MLIIPIYHCACHGYKINVMIIHACFLTSTILWIVANFMW